MKRKLHTREELAIIPACSSLSGPRIVGYSNSADQPITVQYWMLHLVFNTNVESCGGFLVQISKMVREGVPLIWAGTIHACFLIWGLCAATAMRYAAENRRGAANRKWRCTFSIRVPKDRTSKRCEAARWLLGFSFSLWVERRSEQGNCLCWYAERIECPSFKEEKWALICGCSSSSSQQSRAEHSKKRRDIQRCEVVIGIQLQPRTTAWQENFCVCKLNWYGRSEERRVGKECSW